MNQSHHLSRGRDEHPSASYQDFLSTQPPLFHKADEPLDADAWFCTIESKFALLSTPCSDANKALFAAQQLRGTARIWWDHYYSMQPAGHVVTGMNSGPLSERTTFHRDLSSESSMNS
jgi:hypothetical protein